MSVFNKDLFLNTQVTQSLSTSRPAIPEHESRLCCKSFDIRTPKESVIMDIQWIVDSEEARNATNMDEPTVRQSIFLDLDESGFLDTREGKNIQLGRLRKALNQNNEGQAWSPSMIVGGVCMGKITQRPNDKDVTSPYNDVEYLTSI